MRKGSSLHTHSEVVYITSEAHLLGVGFFRKIRYNYITEYLLV